MLGSGARSMGVASLVRIVLLLAISQVFGTCDKATFYTVHKKRLIADALQDTEETDIRQCQRICRLYTECIGFNVRWSDREKTRGFCEILGIKETRGAIFLREYETNVAYSYIGVCPASMFYQDDVDRCYLYKQNDVTWEEGQTFCHHLHPMAHIVDLETSQEEEVMINLLPDGKYWLGARRREGDAVNDMYWTYTDTPVDDGYSNWKPEELGTDGPCARLLLASGIARWRVGFCNSSRSTVCEF